MTVAMVKGAFVPVDVSDVPFAVVDALLIDLPRPPSLNHIWRYGRKGVRPSPVYESWKRAADAQATLQRIFRGRQLPMLGNFEATILFADGKRGDLDNLAKGILDWCQSRNVIANDKNCRRLILEFVDPTKAPLGARLTLRSVT